MFTTPRFITTWPESAVEDIVFFQVGNTIRPHGGEVWGGVRRQIEMPSGKYGMNLLCVLPPEL
jgi:hypothetical protein